ncbi:MAG: DUF6779 domain-containing protein, partial [Pseudonocardiaceae bacterium]
MNGRRDDPRGRRLGGPWLIVGLSLAVVATVLLVLSEDVRWLRLGIVAALWAALLGAFLATKYRRQAESAQAVVSDAQAVYELELEREIAARREFELEAEAGIRRRAEAESRDELATLRAEVTALKESLQQLFGGEVLYERVALTAQSTRMRSLAEDGKYLPPPPVAAQAVEYGDARTELIARVLATDAPVRRQSRREPQRPQHREPGNRSAAEPAVREHRSGDPEPPKRETSGAGLFSAEPFTAGAPRVFVNDTLPEQVRQIQLEKRPGGRRRKPDDGEAESGGGRRRRAEGEPAWNAFEPVTGARAGRHTGGTGHAKDPDPEAGSHA